MLLLTQIVRVCCGPYAKGAGRLADCRISLAVDDTGPAVGLFKLTMVPGRAKWWNCWKILGEIADGSVSALKTENLSLSKSLVVVKKEHK